jgi:ribonuclease Z
MAPALEVLLTGTGTPVPDGRRAGAGTLVRYGRTRLQFDAGRATALRLSAAGVGLGRLTALFLTHHHSDHVVDVADVVMARWISLVDDPLPVVAPFGPAADFAATALDGYAADLAVRSAHTGRTPPRMAVTAFRPTPTPSVVWEQEEVVVQAVTVHHEPVEPAVAYRVDTPDGAVVISGDTRVCREVVELAEGARIVVHEACRPQLLAGSGFEGITSYHASTRELGAAFAGREPATMVLTHLIPPPRTAEEADAFGDDLREQGYRGEIVVGEDLTVVRASSGLLG